MSWRILEKLFDSWRHIGDIVGLGVIPLKSGLNCIRLHHLISFNYKNFCKRQQPDNLNQATGFNIDYTMSINLSAKPPNIIIYNFKEYALGIQGTLGQYLDSDRYVFLNLNERQLISEPWSTNTELVIITSGENPEPVQRVLLKYLKENGKILSLGSDFLSNLKVKLLKSTNVDNDEYLQISHEVFGDTKLRLIGNLCSSESFNGQKIALCAKTNAVAIGALRDVDSHGLVVFSQVCFIIDDLIISV